MGSEPVRLWSSLRCLLDRAARRTWQPCRTEAAREAALPSRPGPDRHVSVSNQAEQQIHHLHQIKIDPERIYALEGDVSAMKATQQNTACNKKAASSLWLPSEQPPNFQGNAASTPTHQACQLFLLQHAGGGCWEVQILVLCYVTLAWAQVHLKMRRNAEGHKAISEMKAGGRTRDAEGHRLWTAAMPLQTDWTERQQVGAEADNREALMNHHRAQLWV